MDKIFKLYSLEEIANRTHISPITLKKLFDKLVSHILFNFIFSKKFFTQ